MGTQMTHSARAELANAVRRRYSSRRRIRMRTLADWHEPLPGSMEMDLLAP